MKLSLTRNLFLLLLLAGTVNASLIAKDKRPEAKAPDFKLTYDIQATSVKDQYRTSTCWSFATISFLESEILRNQHKDYNLSEMYIIRKVYLEKAERFIRMHGNMNFAGGGEPNDVIDAIKKYGLMPEEAYSGLLNDSLKHNHIEMDKELRAFVNSIIRNPQKNYTDDWKVEFKAIMDKYLGKVPETFKFEGTKYTPESFANSLDLNLDDYILITSFSHHPFYSRFILEVPDNWSWGEVYNVPLNELTRIADTAITEGYSLVWAADNTEKGFDFNDGMAVVPKILYESGHQKEKLKIDRMSTEEREKLFFNLNNPVDELTVTQQNRQDAFDNYSTTDDHGMHIVGKALGRDGKEYYYVKNSWGINNKYSGYLYVSDAYFMYKTISIMVDKKAIPQELRNRLKL